MGKRQGQGRNPEPISAKAGDDIDVRSTVDGPVARLPELQRSLLFAEISMLSYLESVEAIPVFERLGFVEVEYIERDGAQAYRMANEVDVVVACRGTEPNEWNDIQADANAFTDLAETIGRVHRGFKREVDDLWPEIEASMTDENRTVWFCGHSLGGAMATICAGRCEESSIAAVPYETFTFGSPRVGTRRYVQHADIRHIRWVHNNDIVTRVPPTWLGYRHTGTRRYIDSQGRVRRLTPQQRAKDRWEGFVAGAKQRRFDHFSDHAIAGYVEHLANAVRRR